MPVGLVRFCASCRLSSTCFGSGIRFGSRLPCKRRPSLHCVCVGFGPGLRGGARGPFIRRWILPPLVAFRMFWIGFRGFQIGFGVGGFGVGFKVMALGFNVLGQWFGVQGPGFMVLGLGFTVLGTGFEGLGLGFAVGGCLRLLGLGCPVSWRSLEPQPQNGPGLNVSSQNARTLVPTHSRLAPKY